MSASDFFGDLEIFRRAPVPDLTEARRVRIGYRHHAIDLATPFFAEPLVAASDFGLEGENAYYRADAAPYWLRAPGAIPDLLVRPEVGRRLARADARLRARGLRLHLLDAWRPLDVQRYFHDVWMPAHLHATRPGLFGDALLREVERYWAAPTAAPDAPAPHETGAAVDLTIALVRTGEALEMGSLFDDMHPVAAADHFELPGTVRGTSDEEARANRRLLRGLLTAEGLASHPDEWWHFSWGDQMWARLTGAPAAVYGLARPSGTAR